MVAFAHHEGDYRTYYDSEAEAKSKGANLIPSHKTQWDGREAIVLVSKKKPLFA